MARTDVFEVSPLDPTGFIRPRPDELDRVEATDIPPHFIDGRVYLAGPMTGYPEFNAPAFRAAARALRAAGWDVVSPVELDENDGFDHSEHPDGTVKDEGEYTGFLGRDLKRMIEQNVQAVVVLPGWEQSRGAALEVHVARELGLGVYAYPTLDPVKRPTDYRPPSVENVLEEADRIVAGDRGSQYGPPSEDFERTAGAAEALGLDASNPLHIPLLMILVKLSRLQKTPNKRDSVVDIAGYAKTYEMAHEDITGEKLR